MTKRSIFTLSVPRSNRVRIPSARARENGVADRDASFPVSSRQLHEQIDCFSHRVLCHETLARLRELLAGRCQTL